MLLLTILPINNEISDGYFYRQQMKLTILCILPLYFITTNAIKCAVTDMKTETTFVLEGVIRDDGLIEPFIYCESAYYCAKTRNGKKSHKCKKPYTEFVLDSGKCGNVTEAVFHKSKLYRVQTRCDVDSCNVHDIFPFMNRAK